MERQIVIGSAFRGPPTSGNGGYVCGLMAGLLGDSHERAPVTGILRAPIPLEAPLRVSVDGQHVRLTAVTGELIAEAVVDNGLRLPVPPCAPLFTDAEIAGREFVGLHRPFHPICFTCAEGLAEGVGLRVFTGPIEGDPDDVVAGVWLPHQAFADDQGLTRLEVVWAALDCPGSVAWLERGGQGGLLGTMTCKVLRRPAVGEACIVTAWPIETSGRKSLSGTALFSHAGELLARSHQIWIGRAADSDTRGVAIAF